MKYLKNQRTRLLLICKDRSRREKFITLFTGYRFYVDYVDTFIEGIKFFRAYRHPIVIVDKSCLRKNMERIIKTLKRYQQNCIFLASAEKIDEELIHNLLKQGFYDIIDLPLNPVYIHYNIERVVNYYYHKVNHYYHKLLLYTLLWLIPLLAILFIQYVPGLNHFFNL